MKTDDLIRGLAEDRHVGASPRRAVAVALLASIPIVALLFSLTLGPRPHLDALFATWRFSLKVVYSVALAGLAAHAVMKLANPVERPGRVAWSLLPAVLLLLAGVAAELWLLPSGEIRPRMIGTNSMACLVSIPLFSIMPLAIFFYAMRDGAPASATASGALIGVLASALGAAFYALHCTDDSPLFVALWYSIAMAGVAAAGALLGRWLLRW